MTLQTKDSLVKEIIFIDPTVEDYESLLAGIYPDTKVVILDRMKDGISQITENLQGGTYKAVHIVSHGGEGSLQLGSKQLNSSNLDSYKSQLQQWAKYLTDEADILLYGCDVAAGKTGVGFVQQLSQLTGADVAASNDLTGSAALGGDWDLEVKTGKIEVPLAFQIGVMEAYNDVLATAPDVIINEFSQGSDNAKEWVEILVVKDNLNLQNYRLIDGSNPNSLNITLSGSGFSSLKAGTLIVLYNGGDVDGTITPDLTYNPAIEDYVLQISSLNSSGHYAVTRNTGWSSTNGAFNNTENADVPYLLNQSGSLIHKFARSTTPGSAQSSNYTGNSATGATSSANWSLNVASSSATPGKGNGESNKTWINNLRGWLTTSTPSTTINNPTPTTNEQFGFSLAASGNNILIGTPLGNLGKGEAFRFDISNGITTPAQTFTNPSNKTGDLFGFAVATDGTNYLIGASKWDGSVQDVGIAYQFNASGINQKTFNNSVNNDDSEFGSAIAILSNGNYVISAPEKGKNTASDNAGQVRLFSSDGTLLKDINNPETTVIQDARFGFSVAAAVNNIVIGSPGFTSESNFGAGKAYLYNTISSIFQDFTNPNASSQDFFGFSVASNSDGTRFLVGAPGENINGTAGIAYLFDNNSTLLRTFTNPDTTNQGFGASVAFVGKDIVIGSSGSFAFNTTTSAFTPIPGRGAVYLYDGDATSPIYNLERIFTNPGTGNDGFGAAFVRVSNNRIAISAPYYDVGSNTDAGIAYIYNSVVSITAKNNQVIESDSNTVTYLIKRDIATDALTVKLELDASSTATAADYTLKDSNGNTITFTNNIATVTLQAGQTTFDVILTPKKDSEITEVLETVKFNLVADTAYTLSPETSQRTATVTIIDDTIVTNTNDSGSGSLRQAILNANAKPGADTITFEGSVFTDNNPDTITLTSDYLEITDALTIQGTGANKLTVSGNNAYRVFYAKAPLTINGLKITEAYGNGGGGGILSSSSVTLNNSIISGNRATNEGGGINANSVTLNNSIVSGNEANFGGGVQSDNVILINSTVSNNTALTIGGAIYSTGLVTLSNSTIAGNISQNGAGISSGSVNISNSTISGNTANESGGGIMTNAGNISNSTITLNIADADKNGTGDGGGIYKIGGVLSISSSIIAGNIDQGGEASDVYGNEINGNAYNLISSSAGITSGTLGTGTDIVNSNPRLAPLGNYGGTTQTHALLSGSVAINAGDPNYNGDLTTDQRGTGFNRKQGVRIDIGAFEFVSATNSINGGSGADNLIGTDGIDRISGLDNNDIIYGGLGSDRIFGDNGNDTLYGDLETIPTYGVNFTMDDTIAGGLGSDIIYGNLGNDKLYGDEGNDQIWGGEGKDEIWGSYGNDTLYGGTGKDAFVLVRGQGADTIMDFTTEDVLGCAGALRYSSLSFKTQNGDTLITDTGTNQLLATLKGFTDTVSNGGLF